MIALSPQTVARHTSDTPACALPKIFQMSKGGKLTAAAFQTKSMMVSA